MKAKGKGSFQGATCPDRGLCRNWDVPPEVSGDGSLAPWSALGPIFPNSCLLISSKKWEKLFLLVLSKVRSKTFHYSFK